MLLLKVIVIYEGVQIRVIVTFFTVTHYILKEVIVLLVLLLTWLNAPIHLSMLYRLLQTRSSFWGVA